MNMRLNEIDAATWRQCAFTGTVFPCFVIGLMTSPEWFSDHVHIVALTCFAHFILGLLIYLNTPQSFGWLFNFFGESERRLSEIEATQKAQQAAEKAQEERRRKYK